jgi:small subunit ribosomal protein S6
MRPYEIMVILDPTLDERTVAPSLETFLNVVRKDGGSVDKVDMKAEPATVSELDRQLSLNESVLRTKVMRIDKH